MRRSAMHAHQRVRRASIKNDGLLAISRFSCKQNCGVVTSTPFESSVKSWLLRPYHGDSRFRELLLYESASIRARLTASLDRYGVRWSGVGIQRSTGGMDDGEARAVQVVRDVGNWDEREY